MPKSNGMRGQKHKVDSDGITPLKWRSNQKTAAPVPDGGAIKVKFPNGPDGGTWGASTMSCRAYFGDKSIGLFMSWDDARSAIEAGATGRKAKSIETDQPASSIRLSDSELASELERRGNALLEAARIVRGEFG